jgi:hypothetical protein
MREVVVVVIIIVVVVVGCCPTPLAVMGGGGDDSGVGSAMVFLFPTKGMCCYCRETRKGPVEIDDELRRSSWLGRPTSRRRYSGTFFLFRKEYPFRMPVWGRNLLLVGKCICARRNQSREE